MTIRMLQAWNGLPEQLVTTLSSSEESRLVGLGLASFDLDGPGNTPLPVFATKDLTGRIVILGPNGEQIVAGPDDAYALPSSVVRITATQIVVGHPIGLKSVSCIAGTTITLTLYDNGTVGAGNKLFEKSMSVGDKFTFPTAVQAINGIQATYSGTATFDVEVQNVG